MKRKRKFICVLCCLAVFSSGPASAGIPVLDYSNLASAIMRFVTLIIQYSTQLKQYSSQVAQVANQYQQLRNEAQNLKNLNYLLNIAGLDKMQQIMRNAQGIANDYATLQRVFDQKYPDFVKYSKMSGKDFAAKALEWNEENRRNIKAAQDIQAELPELFRKDVETGKDLLSKAAQIQGARDGLQTIAQIGIHQTKQLMQLQQLMAASQRAESSFMAQKSSGEAAARAKKDNLYRDWASKGNRNVNTKIDKLH